MCACSAGRRSAGRARDTGSSGEHKEVGMASRAWTGWIAFAGWIMILIGGLDFFEGLIAVIRDKYYVLTPSQVIVFDVTTWGWITMIWGVVLVFAGLALLSGASWARWFTIVVVSLNIF